MGKYKLVYFPVRGRGEAIRLLLTDNDVALDEVSPMPFDNFQKEWKPKLPFGQLPALYDGDFQLVQSNAILRYLARRHGLYGSDDKTAALIDQLNDGVEDQRGLYAKLIYTNYEEGKAEYLEKLPKALEAFEGLLSKANAGQTGAAVNGKVSFVDYNLFDLLDIHLILSPTCLDSFPCLKAYHAKMAAKPNIAKYRQTEGFKTRPINGNGKQ